MKKPRKMTEGKILKAAKSDPDNPPLSKERLTRLRRVAYSKDEKRVCDYIQEITNGTIGCGEDPIGFLIASHRTISWELREWKLK